MADSWNPFKGKSPEQRDLAAHQAARSAHLKAREDLLDKRRALKEQMARVQKRLEMKFEEYQNSPKATKKIVERELRQIKRSLESLLEQDGVIEKGVLREDASIQQIEQNIAMIEQKMVTGQSQMSHDDIAVIGEEYRDELLAQDEAVEGMKVQYGVDADEEAEGDIEDELADFIDIPSKKENKTRDKSTPAKTPEDSGPAAEKRQRRLDELKEE